MSQHESDIQTAAELTAPQLFEQQFLSLLARKSGTFDTRSYRILAKLVNASINQHSCIDLSGESPESIAKLSEHAAIGQPGEHTPIIMAGQRLYLAKFYDFEKRVAQALIARNRSIEADQPPWLAQALNDQFSKTPGDRQKLAAFLAITRMLTIITGGPGTGKTSTVVRLLNILLAADPNLDIKLAAPTGKAAMRLADGIGRLNQIEIRNTPEVRTLHRLLGVRSDGRSFRYHADNLLPADILIVDEASMIDLQMMDRLLAALAPSTRLILLGDPNQLPSVDTGNVLADLCAQETGFTSSFREKAAKVIGDIPSHGALNQLSNAICRLERSYRFADDSGIATVSENIRLGSASLEESDDSVTVTTISPDQLNLIDYWPGYQKHFQTFVTAEQFDHASLFTTFDECRILCSRRGGDTGVEALNRQIETELEQRGLKQRGDAFYPGRPILITQNDYNLSLFNGDIGICLQRQDASGETRYLVHFPDNDNTANTAGETPVQSRSFLTSRLPNHETCFAMTVHKSQGSEFDHVVLIVADERSEEASSLMTRELLYTGVTRARKSVTLHTTQENWQRAIKRTAARTSGMTAFLAAEKLEISSSDELTGD